MCLSVGLIYKYMAANKMEITWPLRYSIYTCGHSLYMVTVQEIRQPINFTFYLMPFAVSLRYLARDILG